MPSFSSIISSGAIHLAVGLLMAGIVIWFEASHRRRRKRRALEDLSWLFPISQEKPEMDFTCSLKPGDRFKPSNSDQALFTEFFGQNPSTYRRYVHSAEVLALQMITEKLSPLGVKFSQGGFYGGGGPNRNLLLIGSESNNQMSTTTLEFLKKRIDRVEPPGGGHKYFQCGGNSFHCDHEVGADGLARVTRDFGVIVRRTLADGSIVLLLAGIHMHGTLAAAQVALNPAFQQRVLAHKYPSFAQLVSVNVLNDGCSIDVSSLDTWKDLPFVNLD